MTTGRYHDRICAIILLGILNIPLACAADNFEQGMNALLDGNYAEAYCIWKPLAQRGHAEAQYNIGWLYANGNGLNVDPRLAVQWWQKAATQGHVDAQFAVGMAYITGEGLKKDLKVAMHWFIAAALQEQEDAREILQLLSADPSLDILRDFPQLLSFNWFGQPASIRKDAINVRKSPSTRGKILSQLNKGDSVRIIQTQGGWSFVVLPGQEQKDAVGQTGWIYSELLSVNP